MMVDLRDGRAMFQGWSDKVYIMHAFSWGADRGGEIMDFWIEKGK